MTKPAVVPGGKLLHTSAPVSRRVRLVLIIVGAAAAVSVLLAWLLYPKIGSWVVRTRVLPRVAEKLGRDLTVGTVSVGFGHVEDQARDVDRAALGPHPLRDRDGRDHPRPSLGWSVRARSRRIGARSRRGLAQ